MVFKKKEKVNSNWFSGNVQRWTVIRILYYNVESNNFKKLQFLNDHNYKVNMKI